MTPVDASSGVARAGTSDAVGRVVPFLETRLETLVDRSIEIAKRNGYAPFTTTIRAAWVEAIVSVTESLGNYLTICEMAATGPRAALEYRTDPRFARMRELARQHRSFGVTLTMYVGLFKHFRNLYIDELTGAEDCFPTLIIDQVRDFFDETELSISDDWRGSDDTVRLRELQEQARSLSLNKDRYHAIFESLRNPAFLLDKAQQIVDANQAAAEMFLGDAKAGEIIYLRSMRSRKKLLQEVVDHINEATHEPDHLMWLETHRGSRCFDVRRRILHDAVENIAIGHVVILNDVTEHRRAAERALKSERAMSRFLATMSHEIRTPLHGVLGATELLRTADSGGSTDDYLDLIEAAGQTLLQTLNNVLDYSKLRNELPKPRPVSVNLAQNIAAFDRVAAAGRKLDNACLCFEISPELPFWIEIDWAMTQQVLSNLVSNAIRVDDGRGVRVSLSEATKDMACRYLRFEVRDHGPGISADEAKSLFRPFERASARETGSGGAGLGLAISHHLVEAMSGTIGYRNLKRGALVWFEVPFVACSAPAPSKRDVLMPVTTDPQTTPCCLLVDDDPIGSKVTKLLLERLGFHVDHAMTIAAASRASQSTNYDVFVVDYILPDGDGPSLVRNLRRSAPRSSFYVALTANVEALASDNELSQLFSHILAKPVDQKTLSTVLSVPHSSVRSAVASDALVADDRLDGLAPGTILAMIETFQEAWNSFRRDIGALTDKRELAFQAHRLAGSTAILGLTELEIPLREFEKCCESHSDNAKILRLLTQLDCDLTEIGSWNHLCERSGLL